MEIVEIDEVITVT